MKANFGITIDKFVVAYFKIVADVFDAAGRVDLDLYATAAGSPCTGEPRRWGECTAAGSPCTGEPKMNNV